MQHPIEQVFIAILQRRETYVLAEVIGLTGNRLVDSLRLRLNAVVLGRQQALQPESRPLFRGKPRAFVQKWKTQNRRAASSDPQLQSAFRADQVELIHYIACCSMLTLVCPRASKCGFRFTRPAC